jgi:hypothetical protein
MRTQHEAFLVLASRVALCVEDLEEIKEKYMKFRSKTLGHGPDPFAVRASKVSEATPHISSIPSTMLTIPMSTQTPFSGTATPSVAPSTLQRSGGPFFSSTPTSSSLLYGTMPTPGPATTTFMPTMGSGIPSSMTSQPKPLPSYGPTTSSFVSTMNTPIQATTPSMIYSMGNTPTTYTPFR